MAEKVKCAYCSGSGKCSYCSGKGRTTCDTCKGSGKQAYKVVTQESYDRTPIHIGSERVGTVLNDGKKPCESCSGAGTIRCTVCSGAGKCPSCDGKGGH